MPSSPEEFREFAQECLRWAGETKSERHHQALLEMSRTWIERSSHIGGGDPDWLAGAAGFELSIDEAIGAPVGQALSRALFLLKGGAAQHQGC